MGIGGSRDCGTYITHFLVTLLYYELIAFGFAFSLFGYIAQWIHFTFYFYKMRQALR
jgi:hypothetical protein